MDTPLRIPVPTGLAFRLSGVTLVASFLRIQHTGRASASAEDIVLSLVPLKAFEIVLRSTGRNVGNTYPGPVAKAAIPPLPHV